MAVDFIILTEEIEKTIDQKYGWVVRWAGDGYFANIYCRDGTKSNCEVYHERLIPALEAAFEKWRKRHGLAGTSS